MEVIKWNKIFEIGHTEIDQQHQHLVDVTNQFGTQLSKNETKINDLEDIFSKLVAYTQYHFTEEEKFMDLAGVDKRHIDHHKEDHRSFLQDVNLLHQQQLDGKITSQDIFSFLMNWLIYHILGSDKKMSEQAANIRSGTTAENAYIATEEQGVNNSTDLLLSALNKLFALVTNRNKQLSHLNQTLEERVKERTLKLTDANRQLDQLASTDALTGIPNRRQAMQLLELYWQETHDEDKTFACIMIDADHFKEINDNFGHDAGDIVLCELAKQLQYSVRTDDIVSRLGGDEFLIICPRTDKAGALKIAKLTHEKVSGMKVEVNGGAWIGSISVGVAVRTEEMQSIEDLIKAADRGVYAAKEAGRNCVKTAS